MKKRMKQIGAFLLVMVMAVLMVTGCTKKSAGSMKEVIKDAINLDKFTYETTINLKADDVNYKVVISGKCDGNAASIGAKISAGGMNFDFNDAIIITEDAIYFNFAEITDKLSFFLSAYGVNLSDYGLENCKFISIEAKGAFKRDMTLINLFVDDFDSAYEELVEKVDGEYTINLNDTEKTKKFVDNTMKMLETNKEKWSSEIIKASNNYDYSAYIDSIIDSLSNSMLKAANEMDIPFDESDIELFREELKSQIGDIESLDEDTIKEAIDEIIDSYKEEKDSDEYYKGAKMTIGASQDKDTYTFEVNFESDTDNDSMTLLSKIIDDSSVKVTVPNDSEVTSFEDFLVPIIKLYLEQEAY